jgi:hypothetical protein
VGSLSSWPASESRALPAPGPRAPATAAALQQFRFVDDHVLHTRAVRQREGRFRREPLQRILKAGKVLAKKGNGLKGANSSEILTLERHRARIKAVFKAGAGEVVDDWMDNIPAGSQYQREVQVYALALAAAVDLVPPTVKRRIEGREGSLQLFIGDAVPLEGLVEPEGRQPGLDREGAELLRAFDYIAGNADRMPGKNMLLVSVDASGRRRALDQASLALAIKRGDRILPVGIDNGQSLPIGPLQHFEVPIAWVQNHVGPIRPKTREFIETTSRRKLAAALAAAGCREEQAVHVCRRLIGLRNNPGLMEIEPPGGLEQAQRMTDRMAEAAASETQGLSPEELREIDEIVAEAFRKQRTYKKTRADYYGYESVALAAYRGFEGEAASFHTELHERWAKSVPAQESFEELLRKMRLVVERLAETDRPAFARFYAMHALRTLRVGAPVPGARGIREYGPHYDWSLDAPVDQVLDEIEARMSLAYNSFKS